MGNSFNHQTGSIIKIQRALTQAWTFSMEITHNKFQWINNRPLIFQVPLANHTPQGDRVSWVDRTTPIMQSANPKICKTLINQICVETTQWGRLASIRMPAKIHKYKWTHKWGNQDMHLKIRLGNQHQMGQRFWAKRWKITPSLCFKIKIIQQVVKREINLIFTKYI